MNLPDPDEDDIVDAWDRQQKAEPDGFEDFDIIGGANIGQMVAWDYFRLGMIAGFQLATKRERKMQAEMTAGANQ